MSQQTVTLRIVGENGKLVAAVRASKAELDSLGKAATGAGQQAERGAKSVDRIGEAAERTRRRTSLLGGALGQLKGLLAGYAGLQGVRALVQTADAYTDIVGKLSQVTKGERELATAKAQTFRIAQQTYQSLDATVTLYTRSAMALKQYNVSQASVVALTQTINQGLLVSRATTAESASAILQLSQAMGAGALRGEEFNAVNEAAPRLMEALAKSIGVPRGELKKLAEDGKLTVDKLLKAWTGAEAAAIAAEASKVPLTIARAWQMAKNEMLRYVGEGDQAAGTSGKIASGIQSIARNLPAIVSALTTAAKMTVAWFALYRGVPAVVAGLTTIRDAYIGIALAQSMGIKSSGLFAAASIRGLQGIKTAAGVLFAAFAGWQIGKWLRENFLEARLFGIAFVNGMLKGWEYLKAGALSAWAIIKAGFLGSINVMRIALADFIGFNAKIAGVLPDYLGGGAATAKLQAMEAALRPTQSAAAGLEAELARISISGAAAVDQIETITSDMADYEIAQHLAGKATDTATTAADAQTIALGDLGDAGKKAADELRRLLEAQRSFARENESLAASLSGPYAQAQFDYADGVRSAREALAKREATIEAVVERERLLAEQLRRTTAEIEREQDVLGRVHADYQEQIYLSGLSTQARAVEEEVIRAVNEAIEAGKPLRKDEIEGLRKFISESERVVQVKNAHQQAAEDYQRNWEGAISSVSGAMGDFFASGLKDSKSFTEGLKDIFKRWLSNVIAIFADGALKRAFGSVAQSVSGWMSSMGNGGGGGGNWLGSIAKMFTGGGGGNGGGSSSGLGFLGTLSKAYSGFTSGFSAAGAAGGGFWSSMMSGFSGAMSAFTGSLGAATTATTTFATTAGSFGTFSGIGGSFVAGGAGAGTGAAAAGAGGSMAAAGAVSWIPIVGWIVAGIMASSAAFKAGWRIDGQKTDMAKYFMKKGDLVMATTSATVGAADSLLRGLGFKDSWAAAFSGSSLHTKLWGHKMPKVEAQGIQGSIGFGGFSGQSYADIKAKGGWFRGDKKWTQTGAIDSTIDRAFDNAAQGVAMRTKDLAKQMGVDISAALATVKIDLGKLQFDKDPKKAREQISEKIGELMENLSAEAVKKLGFSRLLDDGFQASEIMGALSASIALVTGGADKLGRALTELEKENVARATEYFEGLALKSGASLGDEVQRVVGMLGEYSNLITGVDTELQTRGLNQYQSAQLQIELQYRNQVKQANGLAKALGLSGARAEDLAKIEQLRAVSMASLQTQMEAQKNTFLQDLGLSDLSVLTDAQKLAESMQLLRDAVGAGDLQRAQGLSQTALGLSQRLNASGLDHLGVYNEVTGLLGGMTAGGLEGFTDVGLDNIADILTGLPDGIASALFNLVYNPIQQLPPSPVAPPPPQVAPGAGRGGGRGAGGGGLRGGGDGDVQTMVRLLEEVVVNTGGTLRDTREGRLYEHLR